MTWFDVPTKFFEEAYQKHIKKLEDQHVKGQQYIKEFKNEY